MDRHNNGRTASPESGLERREQMQKSVKKSNKKTGAAGKYTAPGAFGGAQPSNLVELIEAQRGKAASSAGKKPAADTALANKWANLQLQSFGQFGADPAAIVGQQAGQTVGGWLRSSAAKPKNTALANEWANLQLQSFGQFGADTLSPTWGRVGETPEMTAAEREREAQWYEQNANAYNALGADGQSTVQRANDAANRWDIANNMYPWMLDTSGLGMPIDQQLAMADAYEERRQATAALEQAANSLPADVDARSLSRYAQQLENARYAQELETSARQGAGEAPILHNAASVAANAWNLPAALDYAKQWARNTFTGDYAPIDVNTPAQTMNIYRDAVRDETGRNIEEGLGGGLAGKAASFAYQTGMSWADSLANMAMSGGNPYLSGVLMGSGTMTSTVRSAKEKGASDSQAMGAGVAAGIFEGLFEQYSIENLSWMAKSDPRTFLDVVKNLGKLDRFFDMGQKEVALYYPIWREKTYAAEDEKTLPQDCCKPRYVIVDGIAHPYTKYSQLPDAFTLRYEAYPADIPDNAPDETEFDLPDEAVLAVIFFAAAQTQSMEYDQRFFQSFYAQYQGKLSNLSGQADGPAAVVTGGCNV